MSQIDREETSGAMRKQNDDTKDDQNSSTMKDQLLLTACDYCPPMEGVTIAMYVTIAM